MPVSKYETLWSAIVQIHRIHARLHAIAVLRNGCIEYAVHQIHAPRLGERRNERRWRHNIFAAHQVESVQLAIARQHIQRLAESWSGAAGCAAPDRSRASPSARWGTASYPGAAGVPSVGQRLLPKNLSACRHRRRTPCWMTPPTITRSLTPLRRRDARAHQRRGQIVQSLGSLESSLHAPFQLQVLDALERQIRLGFVPSRALRDLRRTSVQLPRPDWAVRQQAATPATAGSKIAILISVASLYPAVRRCQTISPANLLSPVRA